MNVYNKTYFIFLLLIFSIITILVWSGINRINDFSEYHQLIGKNSSRNVSESISQFITERKRLIHVFADEHKELIEKSALNPNNEDIKAELQLEVKKYFPEYFSFTITDKNGVPFYDDFDGLIGDLCLSDIKTFLNNKTANPRVHPHHDVYHYDLLAAINLEKKGYIFFISFPADEISTYLKSAQAIGHKTILVLKDLDNIIEITTDGARNKNFREDYRLTEVELSQLLSESSVLGTLWTVYDLHEANLFSDFSKKIIFESILILIAFFLVGILLFSLLKREEKKRIKAEAAKSEFVAIVSHELRTPLTSINGAIKLIENEVLGPINNEIKNYLKMASNNIDRLSGIVDDILDVKKMETGEFKLYRENISLVKVVEQAIFENDDYASKFGSEFELITPEKDYLVYGDKDRLLQVMTNLLSNAVKYGAENDHIKIYFKETAKNIQVNIEDHGNGIDVKDKNILFEKFTQIHSRKSEIVKGTGLGLNITKNIIEKHDGMISFKPGSEGGTIFYIILPLHN